MKALEQKSMGMCYARARRTHIPIAWWHGSQQESTPGSTGTSGLQYRYWWCACGSQVRQCRERGVCYYYDYGVKLDSKTYVDTSARRTQRPSPPQWTTPPPSPWISRVVRLPPARWARSRSIVHSKGSLSDGVIVGSSLQQLVCAHTTHLSVPAPPVKDVAMLAVLRKPTACTCT